MSRTPCGELSQLSCAGWKEISWIVSRRCRREIEVELGTLGVGVDLILWGHIELYRKKLYLYNGVRKKVPGFFQDECVDSTILIINEYVGLRAKSYVNKLWDIEINEYHDKKKSKGVSNRHLQKHLDFDE